MLFFKGTCFSLKLVRNFSFKIDDKPLDLDPNWAKIQNPNLNSMYSIWIHNTGGKCNTNYRYLSNMILMVLFAPLTWMSQSTSMPLMPEVTEPPVRKSDSSTKRFSRLIRYTVSSFEYSYSPSCQREKSTVNLELVTYSGTRSALSSTRTAHPVKARSQLSIRGGHSRYVSR